MGKHNIWDKIKSLSNDVEVQLTAPNNDCVTWEAEIKVGKGSYVGSGRDAVKAVKRAYAFYLKLKSM